MNAVEPQSIPLQQVSPTQSSEKISWIRRPSKKTVLGQLRATYDARTLIKFFALLTLRKTTNRTFLGWLWLPIRCLWPVAVSTIVMGSFLNVQSQHAPYIIYFLSGIIPWTLFALSISWVTRCLELSRGYIRRSYFPKLVLPIAYLAPALVDSTMLSIYFIGASFYYFYLGRYTPTLPDFSVFISAILSLVLGLSLGMLLSIPGARLRDIRFTLGFILGGVFALTPIAYTTSNIPSQWSWLIVYNPIGIAVQGCRAGLIGAPTPTTQQWIYAWCIALFLLFTALMIFIRNDQDISDDI